MSNNVAPLLIKDMEIFDVAHLKYGHVKQLTTNQGKFVYMNYNNALISVQTPEMYVPFGVNEYDDAAPKGATGSTRPPSTDPRESSPKVKYSMNLSFKGKENKDNIRKFEIFMNLLDDRLVQDAIINQKAWFGEVKPIVEYVKGNYTPAIKQSIDKDTGLASDTYPNTFKIALPRRRDAPHTLETMAFGTDQNPLNLDDLVARSMLKGAHISAIITLSNIWIVGKKFGMTWKATQLRIVMPVVLNKYLFLPSEEDTQASDLDGVLAGVLGEPAISKKIKAKTSASVAAAAAVDTSSEADEDADDADGLSE